MPCVYQHIRLDTNEVFYVGISNEPTRRPYSKIGRSKFWRNIVDKTEYKIDILYINITWESACEIESNLIKMYGRRDLGLGPLVNMTSGGEGIRDYKYTQKQLSHKKGLFSGSKNPRAIPCVHFDTKMEFGSLKEGCDYFGLSYQKNKDSIRFQLSGAQFYYVGKYFIRPKKKVRDLTTGTIYNSLFEACNKLDLKRKSELYRITNNTDRKRFEYI